MNLIWGAPSIGKFLGINKRKTYYLLESGQLPARKAGKQWVSSREKLRAYFLDTEAA